MGLNHVLSIFSLIHGSIGALYYPSVQIDLIEHILVDNWGAYASNFSSAITPCINYVSEVGEAAVNSGRTTAAQWIRVAFHDFVTANKTAGTGGIDASIGFETLREENKGSAMNDSFAFWRPFMNKAVSMADLVAIGTTMSINLCGGHKLPFRPGRIDATVADPTTGVPAPETDLKTTLEFFNRASFNKQDAIGLTACGHTLGSVHHGGFPNVVPESAVTPTNTNGGSNFDTSRGVFDSLVVHEYVQWTGQKGGPLVTTDNTTTRSDLRLYESDQNATMLRPYRQGDGFLDTCVGLMGRMIETIPASVKLQDIVRPMAVKPVNVTYDFDANEKAILSGTIRILTPSRGSAPSSIRLGDHASNDTIAIYPEPRTGSSVFGATTYFHFSLPASDSVASAAFISVSGEGFEEETFPLQSRIFVVPSMTDISGTILNLTVATYPAVSLDSAKVTVPVPQQGTLGPRLMELTTTLTKLQHQKDGYDIWQGSVDMGQLPTGLVSVVVLSGGTVADTLMVNSGIAGW